MDVDLVTNGSKIRNSIDNLINGKLSWLILGYTVNKTVDVIETGDDSLEDMFEEFHGSKIMFGFASVTDPNTQLKKNVFLYWQGSAASQNMKTASVQHSNIIRDICKPVHVSITARDDQDLDLKDIMSRVAAASGSNYSYHKETKQVYETKASTKSENNDAASARLFRQKELAQLGSLKKETPQPNVKIAPANTKPLNSYIEKPSTNYNQVPKTTNKPTKVGTNYSKINPLEDIQMLKETQKTTFENSVTINSENNTAQKAKFDRQKELSSMITNRRQSTDQSDDVIKVGTNYKKINPLEEIRRLRSEAMNPDQDVSNRHSHYTRVDPKEEIKMLRKMSSSTDNQVVEPVNQSYQKIDPLQEIKQLRKHSSSNSNDHDYSTSPSYKKINPREEIELGRKSSVSEIKHTFDFKQNDKSNSTATNVGSARQALNAMNTPKQPHYHTQPQPYNVNVSLASHISATHVSDAHDISPKETIVQPVTPVAVLVPSPTSKKQPEPSYNNNNYANNIEPINNGTPISPAAIIDNEPVFDQMTLTGDCARSLYDYQSQDNDEISFDVNEIISEIEQVDDGWWVGVNPRGEKGMFPANYVQLIQETKSEAVSQMVSENSSFVEENKQEDASLTVKALYDYFAQEEDELSFKEGNNIFNVRKVDDGWWEGENQEGDRGLFPSNYVEPL